MLVLGPMDRLGVDICHLGTKGLLVMVNLYSNYKWVKELRGLHMENIIKAMKQWFCTAEI